MGEKREIDIGEGKMDNGVVPGERRLGPASELSADEAESISHVESARAKMTKTTTLTTTKERNMEEIDLEEDESLPNRKEISGVAIRTVERGENVMGGEEKERSLVSYDEINLFFHGGGREIVEGAGEKGETHGSEPMRRVRKNKRKIDKNGRDKKGWKKLAK